MTLREAEAIWNKKYKKFFGCDSPRVQKYTEEHSTLETGLEWINEATAHALHPSPETETAFMLCFAVIEPMALAYFWKFLGPNPTSRKIRIENGDFEVYLGMVYETMPEILKSFKPKYDSMKALCKGLQWWSRGYLKAETERENKNRAKQGDDFNSGLLDKKSPITKMEHPDQSLDDGKDWGRIESEANLYSNVEDQDYEFKEKWVKLCKDPIFSSTKGIAKHNWKNMMAMVLNGDKIEDVAKANGVTASYVRTGLFSNNFSVDWRKFDPELGNEGLIQGLLNKYDIDAEAFASGLRSDPDFVVGELKKNQSK